MGTVWHHVEMAEIQVGWCTVKPTYRPAGSLRYQQFVMRLSHDQEGVKNIAMIENLSAWKTHTICFTDAKLSSIIFKIFILLWCVEGKSGEYSNWLCE